MNKKDILKQYDEIKRKKLTKEERIGGYICQNNIENLESF